MSLKIPISFAVAFAPDGTAPSDSLHDPGLGSASAAKRRDPFQAPSSGYDVSIVDSMKPYISSRVLQR